MMDTSGGVVLCRLPLLEMVVVMVTGMLTGMFHISAIFFGMFGRISPAAREFAGV